MNLLSKQAIIAAQDVVFEDVEVPEWDGTVRVKVMTGSERDRYELGLVDRAAGKAAEANLTDMRARLLAMTLVDENNDLLFTDKEIAVLGSKSSIALDRVYAVAMRLNGLGKAASAAVDAAEKNSVSAPSGASSSV